LLEGKIQKRRSPRGCSAGNDLTRRQDELWDVEFRGGEKLGGRADEGTPRKGSGSAEDPHLAPQQIPEELQGFARLGLFNVDVVYPEAHYVASQDNTLDEDVLQNCDEDHGNSDSAGGMEEVENPMMQPGHIIRVTHRKLDFCGC
jgi:hypothetical protein